MANEEHPWICQKEGIIATQGQQIKNLRDLFKRMEKGVDEKLDGIMTKLDKINGNGRKGFSMSSAIIVALLALVANLVYFIVQKTGGVPSLLP